MQYSAKHEYPPEYKGDEGRRKLADRFELVINATEEVIQQRQDRWSQNRAFYLNENAGSMSKPYPGAPDGHYNLFQTKGDSTTGYILNVITSETPYCEAKVFHGEDVADSIEEICQTFCDLHNYDAALHMCLTNAFLFNLGVMWQTSFPAEVDIIDGAVEILENYRLEFKTIEPEDFVCYPATVTDIERASVVGHKFSRTVGEVKAMQESGEYEPGDIVSTSQVSEDQGWENIPYYGAPPIERAAETADEVVKLHYLVFRALNEKKKMTRYLAIYCKASNTVLSCRKYEFQTLCYSVFRMKRVSEKEGIYSGASKAQDLKQDQLDINKLKNQFLAGIDWNTGGTLFTDGYLGPKQNINYGPNEIVTIPSAQQLVPFAPRVDLNAIIAGIQMTDNHADVVTSISQAMQGAADPDADTAAENMLIAQGSKAGVDTLIGVATEGMAKSWNHLREVLGMEVGDWFPYIGAGLGMNREDVAMIGHTCQFKPRVRTSSGTPQMKLIVLEKAKELMLVPGNNINGTELVKRQLKALEQVGGTSLEDLQIQPAPGLLGGAMEQVAPGFGDPALQTPALGAQGIAPANAGSVPPGLG